MENGPRPDKDPPEIDEIIEEMRQDTERVLGEHPEIEWGVPGKSLDDFDMMMGLTEEEFKEGMKKHLETRKSSDQPESD